MDPLENLCVVKDSFQSKQESGLYKIEKYSEEFLGSPRARRNKIISQKQKEEQEQEQEQESQSLKIPELSKSIEVSGFFKNMSSYVLANVDTIYNFSKMENGYLIHQVLNENYKYTILDSDIGFLEYLQYRLPESKIAYL